MMGVSDTWDCHHFSLANAVGHDPTDLPHLLRRVADEIEQREIQAMNILDLMVSSDIDADGPHWSVTLYWATDQAHPDAHR
jgi:hypothetical protein